MTERKKFSPTKNLLLWLLRKQLTVHVYMKSGNVIVLKNMNYFSIKKNGCDVTEASWEIGFNIFGPSSILNLNLDQVEAVVIK